MHGMGVLTLIVGAQKAYLKSGGWWPPLC